MGATQDRWRQAQRYERRYWQQVADRIATGAAKNLTWYKHRAQTCAKALQPHLHDGAAKGGTVVEVGSGPVGIVTFFEWGTRFALDPLESFYASHSALSALRSSAVTYLEGSGEALPFGDGSVAVVIIDNVLDHTQDPDRVLSEIRRVLDARGALFFKVNIRTDFGTRFHGLLELATIDRGHPHSYSLHGIRRLLAAHGFEVHEETVGDYREVRAADRRSPRWVDRVKGYTGLSEFWYTAVCVKSECG